MRVRTDDGVELAAVVAGSGPGLVLVHGFGGAKEDFADHLDALARDHTVVTFDHRGHGESDQPDDPAAYDFDRLTRDVLAVADAAGLTTFRLLGHSMGGMVARKVAIGHPSRVDALVMMDTSPGPIPGFDPALIDIAVEVAFDEGKDALKALLDMVKALETPAHVHVCETRPGYVEFNERKWDALSAVMWGALAREIARQPDELDAMRDEVTGPVLVIVGEQDESFFAPSRAMAGAIRNATLAVIPDAGHSPQFENPDQWRTVLESFLATVPASLPS